MTGDSKDILAGRFYIVKIVWIITGYNNTLVVDGIPITDF